MKNTVKNQKEETEEKGFIGDITKEFKEVFSERINVIIIAGTFLLGGVSVGGVIFYESIKDSQEKVSEDMETPESLEIRGKHELILNRSSQQTLQEKQEVSPPVSIEKTEITIDTQVNNRKEALREEILSTGSATIGSNPEDIKSLPDLINETLNGQKRK